MPSIWFLFICSFIGLLFASKRFRLSCLFIVSVIVGHIWLLYRKATAHTAGRVSKRQYLDSNPEWKAKKLTATHHNHTAVHTHTSNTHTPAATTTRSSFSNSTTSPLSSSTHTTAIPAAVSRKPSPPPIVYSFNGKLIHT